MVNTDILIIGAGPAGISAALYLARANASFVWLEKSAPGGKLLNIHEVGNYPGIPNANGFDLAMSLLKSTESLGVSSTYGEVKNVHKEDGRFIVATEHETYSSLALIVAAGLSNVPTIQGEKDLFGKGVSYCATCDGPLYRGKTAVIYGKGFQALEEALYLQAIVGKLYLITPEEEYEGEKMMLDSLLAKENVTLLTGTKISKIIGESALSSIECEGKDGVFEIKTDVVFPLFGEKSASAFLSPLGLESNRGFIKVDPNMASSCEGLYAAGDIVDKTLRQVVTAASDGAIAATSAVQYVRKAKK